MRSLLLILLTCVGIHGNAQLNNWDPTWYATDSALVFHDDLDYYLNAYSKKDIKKMRKQVSIWRMNFDKMMRNTVRDIRSYSEGAGMDPHTHDFTLNNALGSGSYSLSGHNGRIRAFMFVSVTSPPARVQMERWSKLIEKYATEDVDLFVIYGREMHPSDKGDFKKYPQPMSIAEKTMYAAQFAQLGAVPVFVDGMDDATFNAYGRAPNGAYLVDKDGNLVFRSTWGDARKMEHMIDTLLKWYKAGKPKNWIPK